MKHAADGGRDRIDSVGLCQRKRPLSGGEVARFTGPPQFRLDRRATWGNRARPPHRCEYPAAEGRVHHFFSGFPQEKQGLRKQENTLIYSYINTGGRPI